MARRKSESQKLPKRIAQKENAIDEVVPISDVVSVMNAQIASRLGKRQYRNRSGKRTVLKGVQR